MMSVETKTRIRSLSTYSFIKTLYDKNRDYLDSFAPLIYKGVPRNDWASHASIQTSVKEIYGIDFPLHLIKTVISSGRRKELISQNQAGSLFQLTPAGVEVVDQIEDGDSVERRLTALTLDLRSFFADKGVEKSESDSSTSLIQIQMTQVPPSQNWIKKTPQFSLIIYKKPSDQSPLSTLRYESSYTAQSLQV